MQGISWTELTITGQSAHAGTTPMRLRHDAGYVAAETRHRSCGSWRGELGGDQVATVGRLELTPNLVNVVAASAVTMTVDLRNTDETVLQEPNGGLPIMCAELAGVEGVTIERRIAGAVRAGRVRRRR